MKNLILFIALLGIWCLSGCIPSLHGIVIQDEQQFDEGIIGHWIIKSANDETFDSSWRIERAYNIKFENESEPQNKFFSMTIGVPSMAPEGYQVKLGDSLPFYILTHQDYDNEDTLTTYMVIELTEIGHTKYMDFTPFPWGIDMVNGRFGNNLIFGHTFAKYEVQTGQLNVNPLNGEHIENLIEQKRIRLKHEVLEDRIVLTAATPELRAFIEKYQSDPSLFDETESLLILD